MIFDSTNLFSDSQAITADAASTNIIDLGVAGRDIGPGSEVPLLIQVTEAFNTLTSVKVSVQTATDAAFTTPVEITSQTLALANLTLGAVFGGIRQINSPTLRYLRVYYDITGSTPSTGKITAGIIPPGNRQENKAYADNL